MRTWDIHGQKKSTQDKEREREREKKRKDKRRRKGKETKQIKIKGTVWKAPEGSAPANASIDFLKKQSF